MCRERVNKVVSEVEEAVSLVRSAEDTWREEMRDVRGEIEGIRELVPRVSATTLHPPSVHPPGFPCKSVFGHEADGSNR